jgi:uncharacterized protein (DUF4415 family)
VKRAHTAKRPTKASRAPRANTDWNRVDRFTDRQIAEAARRDPDAAPIADSEWFRQAKLVLPEPKQAISLRLDRGVLAWFKQRGRGYQTRINAVLKAYVEAQRR